MSLQKGREVSLKTAQSPMCVRISAISGFPYSTHTCISGNKEKQEKK